MTFEEWFVTNRMEFVIGNRAECKAVWEAAQKACIDYCLGRMETVLPRQ